MKFSTKRGPSLSSCTTAEAKQKEVHFPSSLFSHLFSLRRSMHTNTATPNFTQPTEPPEFNYLENMLNTLTNPPFPAVKDWILNDLHRDLHDLQTMQMEHPIIYDDAYWLYGYVRTDDTLDLVTISFFSDGAIFQNTFSAI